MYKKYLPKVLGTSLFAGMNSDAVEGMLNCLRPKIACFKKSDYIVTGGEPCASVGIVLTGTATVSKENAAGNRIVMTLLHSGDIFGEIVAFSGLGTWPASVQAQEACEVLFLPGEKIVGNCEKMCSWHRILIQNFLHIISERAVMLNKKVEYLTIKSMRGKISTYLLEQYHKTGNRKIVLSLNRSELADFLNVSRPSMSREMGKMRDEGIIDFYLTTFELLDLEALKGMCD